MTDDQARTRLRELMGSFEYAYAMGHGCSIPWHPSFELVRREVAELRARLAEADAYGESS